MERGRGRVEEGPMTLRGGQMLSALVVAVFVTLAWAGGPTDTIKAAIEEVIRILENPALKSRAKEAERRAGDWGGSGPVLFVPKWGKTGRRPPCPPPSALWGDGIVNGSG